MLVSRVMEASSGSYTLTGQDVTFVYAGGVTSTPLDRTYAIKSEDRVFPIDRESRVYVINQENRTYVVIT